MDTRETELNRKRKFSDKEMDDIKEDQQQHRHQPKKREQPLSIAAYLSEQMQTVTGNHMDESDTTPPPSAARSLVSALSSTLAILATAATAATTATKSTPVAPNVSSILAKTSSTTTTAMTATVPTVVTKPLPVHVPKSASVASRTLIPASAATQLQQPTVTPKPAPSSTPTQQLDPLPQPQPISQPPKVPTMMSIETDSHASTTEPTSSSLSQVAAAQDESDNRQLGHKNSDNDEEDAHRELDEDRLQNVPLRAQSGRGANGRFTGATLVEYRKYQVHNSDNDEEDAYRELEEDRLQNMPLRAQSGRGANGRFSGATLVEYRKYQVHFREWCIRKRYNDRDNVTTEKFLAYAREVTAREAYEDEVNPHLSIRPIFGMYRGSRRGRINPASMKKRLCAIQFLHREQCHQKRVAFNLDEEIKDELAALMKEYKKLPKDILSRRAGTTSKNNDDRRDDGNKSKVPTARPDKRSGNAAPLSTRDLRLTRSSAAAATTASASHEGTQVSKSKTASEPNSKTASEPNSKLASAPTSKPALPVTNKRPTSGPISRPTQASVSTHTTSTTITSRPAAASIPRVTPTSVSSAPTSTSSPISTSNSASVAKPTSSAISTTSSGSKKKFTGTVSAVSLLSALLSDSATLPPSPALMSALISASNPTSTSTSNSTPTNSASNLTSTVALNPATSSKHNVTSTPSLRMSTLTASAPVSAPSLAPVLGSMSASVITSASNLLASKSASLKGSNLGSKDEQVSGANSNPDNSSGVAQDSYDTAISAADDRRPSVVFNAKSLLRHRGHQGHWNEWCIRKRCEDGTHVTLEKLIKYAMELSAQEPFEDTENPHLSIRPLRNKKKPGMEPPRVSRYTLAQYVSSVRALHKFQCIQDGLTPSKEILGGHRIAAILQDYENFLQSDADETIGALGGGDYSQVPAEGEVMYDDLGGDLSDVYSDSQGDDPNVQNNDYDDSQRDQEDQEDQDNQDYNERANGRTVTNLVGLKKSMQALWTTAWSSPSTHMWMNIHQHRLRSALDYFTDVEHNLSEVLPTHLHLVHVWSEDNQSLFTTGIAITKPFWKEHADQERYSIFLREREVEMCPVGALAFFLLAIWTDKNSLPDFHSEDWRSTTFVSMKSASRTLDSARQLPRNRVLPPAELQRELFPFIEDFFPDNGDWRTWIDNIMMDRPLDTSRPEKERSYYRAADFPAIRLMRVLARLRKVILQDFAVIMTCEGEDGECQFRAEYECAVQHPVFSTPAFRTFALQLFDATRANASSSPRSLTVRGDSTDDLVHALQVQKYAETVVAQERTTDNIQTSLTIRPAHQWRHDIQALLSSRTHSPVSMDVQETYNQDTVGFIQPETDVFDIAEASLEQERMDSPERDGQLEYESLTQPLPSHVNPAVSDQDSSSDESSGDEGSHNGDDLDTDPQETDADPQKTEALQAHPEDEVFMEYESTGMFEDSHVGQHQLDGLDSSATDAIGASDKAEIQGREFVQRELESSESPAMDSVRLPTTNTEVQDHVVQHKNTGLQPLTNNLARVSINANGQSQHNSNNNNSEQLQQVIRALTARVASLEREKKQKFEATRPPRTSIGILPTPEPPSAISTRFSVGTIYREEKNNPATTTTISNEVDQHRQHNQALRDKLVYLEQENKALVERSLQLQVQDQSLGETQPAIATASVSGDPHSDPAIVVPVRDNEGNGNGNNKDGEEDETDGLQHEIQVLRAQLAVKEQEKNATLDYTMASIDSVEFLDTKMVQMQQSMHGLWTMMANNEAARFSMGSSSLGQMQQQQQNQHQPQHQRHLQVQVQDRHHRLRLRVDAMRRRIGTNGYQRL
ncbi:hypothetical protein BGZ96_011274 [Linnemannia gamsii]|uniref:Ndc10 domain-containing protein n=1 Tax=Linnemannia gamsii TaxID=64522 RepID=A0ABQ7JT53_9FUNG|nr:hypothetical protein BGZ96_011274 [Linnemannia gamsii]